MAGLVRGKKAADALAFLKFTPKKAAKTIYKVVASAVANAINNFAKDKEKLVVSKIIVNKGQTLKRSIPASRGRSAPILKRTAHITVEVSES